MVAWRGLPPGNLAALLRWLGNRMVKAPVPR